MLKHGRIRANHILDDIDQRYIFFGCVCDIDHLMTLIVLQLRLLLLVFVASQKAVILSSGQVTIQGLL